MLRLWWYRVRYFLEPKIQYIVITKVHKDDCYDELLICKSVQLSICPEEDGDWKEDRYFIPTIDDISNYSAIRAKLPVFELGEILIVNRNGREISGKGRKPDKWYVEYETFWTLRAAIKRVKSL